MGEEYVHRARPSTVPARRPRVVGTIVVVTVMVVGLGMVLASRPAQAGTERIDGQPVTSLTLTMPHPYTPVFTKGSTDDYHCILLNPHITQNSYIVARSSTPDGSAAGGAPRIPSSSRPPAATAEAQNVATRDGVLRRVAHRREQPGRARRLPVAERVGPRRRGGTCPGTTGTPLPAGSMVIMQVHFNGLVGDRPVQRG